MSLIVIFTIAILIALINSAWAGGRPKQGDNITIYGASIFLRVSLFAGGLLFIFLALGFAYKLGPNEAWPWSLLFLAVALCTVVGWPARIVLNNNEVRQVRFLRPTIVIAKTNIASIEHDPRTHKTTIFSTAGEQITHQRFHVASDDFRKKLSTWHEISES